MRWGWPLFSVSKNVCFWPFNLFLLSLSDLPHTSPFPITELEPEPSGNFLPELEPELDKNYLLEPKRKKNYLPESELIVRILASAKFKFAPVREVRFGGRFLTTSLCFSSLEYKLNDPPFKVNTTVSMLRVFTLNDGSTTRPKSRKFLRNSWSFFHFQIIHLEIFFLISFLENRNFRREIHMFFDESENLVSGSR